MTTATSTATTNTTNNPHHDMRFLRTIPEDRSDLASSLALAPASAATANSSVRGLDAGREGSVVSSARADLAEVAQQRQQTTAASRRRRQEQQPWRRKCSTSSPCVLVSTLLALVGAIVAIVLVTVSDERSDNDASRSPDEVDNIDLAPTIAPSLDPATVQDLDDMLNTLVTMPVKDDVSDDDPRKRAREWMLHEDLLRDDLLQAGHVPSVLQRFVLVELYYATQGDESWTAFEKENRTTDDGEIIETVPFLTPQASECIWEGIYCETQEDTHELVYKIMLNNKNLTGTLTESLYALPILGEISLANNSLTGPLKDLWFNDTVGALPKLFVLDLDSNALTGNIPKALWSRTDIRFVYLNQNDLSGTVFDGVEDEAGEFLEIVWLHQNKQLTGPLPSWLFTMEWLTTFWADDNQFTGSLPLVDSPDSAPMPRLEWLGIKHNKLTGSIQPNHLAGANLKTVHLNDNMLTGPLPVLSPNTPTAWPLQDLWLHNNRFSSAIPTNFGLGWPLMRDLRLTNNSDLTGDISQAQCDTWEPEGEEDQRYDFDCPPVTCSGGCCFNKETCVALTRRK